MKICLTANTGGHLNQLLQLKDFYKKYEYFFIVDRGEFSEGLAKKEEVYFVEKFILKDCIKNFQFLKPWKNLFQTIRVFIKEKPDLVITTGAGTSFGSCVLSKLFLKKLVFIESIARIKKPSTFGKLISPLADKIFVQWKNMLNYYKKGVYAGLLFNLRTNKTKKNNKIFVTTGSYKLQFNRLLKELDTISIRNNLKKEIIAQIGASDYKPKNYKYFDFADQDKIHKLIKDSGLIICQGGSGSIFDSLVLGKKVIAIPRLKRFNEFFDNHQFQLVKELEKEGLILAVYNIKNLTRTIRKSKKFKPALYKNKSVITDLLDRFVSKNFIQKE